MSITRSRTPIENRYSLKGHILEDIKEAKYLGVTLSSNLTWNTHICNITGKASNLTWNTHICNITGKANKLLGFLQRNLKVRNETTKENAYKVIVRLNLEYCSTVWSPLIPFGIRSQSCVLIFPSGNIRKQLRIPKGIRSPHTKR
jgi:hypothetical protein